MNTPAQPLPWLLDLDQAASLATCSRRTLEARIAAGTGPVVVRIGRLVRVRQGDLRDWLDAQRDPLPGSAS
jgi:predicted DNA-binding transcriptional regulator AlpA